MPRNGTASAGKYFAFWILAAGGSIVVSSPLLLIGQSITENFPRLDWQPTLAIPDAHYVGGAACAKCHPAEAGTQPLTPMGHAAEVVAECKILRSHPRLTFRQGRYRYAIVHKGQQSLYEVSDGTHAIVAPIFLAFGLGEAGQTYVFNRKGSYFQSRVSFFNDVRRLGITLGAPQELPKSLEEAAGAVITDKEARLCFGCHTTAAVSGARLQIEKLIPGVTCEGCHGPGGDHVAAITRGELQTATIFNPGQLRAGDLADFCGSCHRSSLHVGLMGVRRVETVRFQPYRLANSGCFDPDDRRISCLACHNPHEERRRDAMFYDAKCLACHRSSSNAKPSDNEKKTACPIGIDRCVTCHMPKYELPGGHFKFTDHWIRVVKPHEACPG